jgi:hypothetical protein
LFGEISYMYSGAQENDMAAQHIDPISYIESTYHVQLKRASGDEYYGACPFCGGDDRFRVWQQGNYWCRPGPGHCGKKGWVDDLAGVTLTSEQRRLLAIESKQREFDRQQAETERRLSALERMARCTDYLHYHRNIPNEKMEYWLDEGMTVDTIVKYRLGWCPHCPTDREGRASFTIPVFDRAGDTLINIRHRLEDAPGGDKYRPHLAGLGAQLFNASATNGHNPDRSRLLVVEGEKKSIVLDQFGYANVGIMGKRSFKKEWLEWLEPFRAVYVALDPDAQESARRLAAMFDGRGRVVHLPTKADDFFTIYGGTQSDFESFVRIAGRA